MDNIANAIKVIEVERECVGRQCDRDCGRCDLVMEMEEILEAYNTAISALKEFLNMIDKKKNGILIELPCAENDTVYKIVNQRDNFDDHIYEIVSATNFHIEMLSEIGKTVFLTKEEANEALKEKDRRNSLCYS